MQLHKIYQMYMVKLCEVLSIEWSLMIQACLYSDLGQAVMPNVTKPVMQ